MRISTDLGLKEAQDYANKLKKAEKAKELKEQVKYIDYVWSKQWVDSGKKCLS